jgi:serine/threonine protein kinase
MEIPRIGRLDLLSCPLLGKGGMARVRKVKLEDHEVAVKIPVWPNKSVYIEAIRREARVLSNLSGGPNIVTFKGIIHLNQPSFQSEFTPCSIFELIDGPDLGHKCLKGGSPLSTIQALNVTKDISLALAYAHQRGVAHGDVKPGNILWKGGRGVLIDFDQARDIGSDAGTARTDGYMAPECYTLMALSGRTDIFALGITLFEISTGIHAISRSRGLLSSRSDPDFGTVEKKVSGSNLSTPVKDLILRMAALAPQDRPLNCQEVMEAVEKTKEKL